MTLRSRKRKSANSSGAPELPKVFVDRSLGRHEIAIGLREAGFELQTLAEVFTERRGQRTRDPVWIRYAARNDLVIFTKDDNLLVEHRSVIRSSKAKLFVLPHAGLPGAIQLQRYIEHRYRIARAARKNGPFAYRLYPSNMQRVHL